MQAQKERVTLPRCGQKNSLFRTGAMGDYSGVSRQGSTDSPLDFVVVNDKLLLQHLYGVQAVRRLLLGQHHFPKIAFPKHSQEIEIIKANFPLFCYLLL
jgi:hypothetical protein